MSSPALPALDILDDFPTPPHDAFFGDEPTQYGSAEDPYIEYFSSRGVSITDIDQLAQSCNRRPQNLISEIDFYETAKQVASDLDCPHPSALVHGLEPLLHTKITKDHEQLQQRAGRAMHTYYIGLVLLLPRELQSPFLRFLTLDTASDRARFIELVLPWIFEKIAGPELPGGIPGDQIRVNHRNNWPSQQNQDVPAAPPVLPRRAKRKKKLPPRRSKRIAARQKAAERKNRVGKRR